MNRDVLPPSVGARQNVVAFLFLCAIVAVFAAGYFWWSQRPLPFDRSQWDATPEIWSDTTRHRMADGLLESGSLMGMTEAEIITLLGEPYRGGDYFSEYDLVYVLGSERGLFRIDSEWLVMRLTSGKVTEAHLAKD